VVIKQLLPVHGDVKNISGADHSLIAHYILEVGKPLIVRVLKVNLKSKLLLVGLIKNKTETVEKQKIHAYQIKQCCVWHIPQTLPVSIGTTMEISYFVILNHFLCIVSTCG
jgi:hypothetical protein